MCNLYSITKGQQAIRDLYRVMDDRTGNLPPLPGIFPDYAAPIVRHGTLINAWSLFKRKVFGMHHFVSA